MPSKTANDPQSRRLAGGKGPAPGDDLKGLRKLDPVVITRMHNEHFPSVFRYARYRLGDEAQAEDVAGEAFARLLEYVHKGRGPRKNVRGWLMRTAANLVNDYFRAQYARPTEELQDTLAADDPGPVSLFETMTEKEDLLAAMKKLTEEQANVLALRFGSGLSLAETAAALGKKANAIKALQFRAIAALRRHLSEEGRA